MEVKILIFEDDLLTAKEIETHLRNAGYQDIFIASTLGEADVIIESTTPDIAILDIHTPGNSIAGIHLGKKINAMRQTALIYITGYSEDQSLKSGAFDTYPAAFLTKPLNEKTLLDQIALAVFKLAQSYAPIDLNFLPVTDRVFIRKNKKLERVLKNEILYVAATGACIEIVTLNNKYTCSSTLAAFTTQVNEPFFFKLNRTYIINLNAIKSITSEVVVIEDGTNISLTPQTHHKLTTILKVFRTKPGNLM